LRFLEPQGTDLDALWQRLFDGTYRKPFIVDTGTQRLLHFDFDSVQSAMSVEHPERLSLAYTRKMMAFLLFNAAPARILLLGLGGGSLAKFCYQHLPGAAITSIEVNPNVIALREHFLIPKDDARFRIVCAESSAYVAEPGRDKDVILVDACDRNGLAPQLNALEFYQHAWRRLTPAGVLVLNLCGERANWASHMAKLQQVFGEGFMVLAAHDDGNVIVFAFKQPDAIEVDWLGLESGAGRLKHRFGIDFPRYVRRMARDWKRRRQPAHG
jgi:spermidine synthase